jgi:NAD(P)-dependent dehydrogenase (short-subunit alcohol dehydrogenase family)
MSRNLIDLKDRRILVTRASSGLGREPALLLSQLRATLTLTGLDPERLGQTLDALHQSAILTEALNLSNLDLDASERLQRRVPRAPFMLEVSSGRR